jgi:hypothetical protein
MEKEMNANKTTKKCGPFIFGEIRRRKYILQKAAREVTICKVTQSIDIG